MFEGKTKSAKLESNGDVLQPIAKIPRTYTHSKPMTDKVMQEQEMHGQQ